MNLEIRFQVTAIDEHGERSGPTGRSYQWMAGNFYPSIDNCANVDRFAGFSIIKVWVKRYIIILSSPIQFKRSFLNYRIGELLISPYRLGLEKNKLGLESC